MAQKKKYEKYCNFTRRKSTYPPQGGYHDSGIMLEREEGAIGKRKTGTCERRVEARKPLFSAPLCAAVSPWNRVAADPSSSHRHRPFPSTLQCVKPLIPPPRCAKPTPVLCSTVCICAIFQSRGCPDIILSPFSTVPLSSTPYSLLYRARSELSRPLPWFVLPSNLFPIFIKIVYIFSVQIMLSGRGIKSLSNLVIQLREVCNHPDLLESAFDGSWLYPPVNEIVEQCENFRLLEWLLKSYLQAEADCTKAINLDKKNVKVYFRRGRAREMLGYYTDAIDESLRKLEEQPEWLRGGKLCGKLCDYHVSDEMGLGKTVHSVSMLGFLQNAQQIHGPFLVVVHCLLYQTG
ncbi:Protein CHROMATIN REMODELING [Arachis hypogaea]|nr:Protein CHROMATIN REMODELING [Arachis hypogaea]